MTNASALRSRFGFLRVAAALIALTVAFCVAPQAWSAPQATSAPPAAASPAAKPAAATASAPAASTAKGALQIYFVDVEGGQSTLFVTPAGQSLLIDTGWPDNAGRDADRIVAAAMLAGISKIDFVLLTHYHTDHAGGVPQLAARIPIGTFIDHGPNRETTEAATEQGYLAYQALLHMGNFKHILATPGLILPLTGIKAEIVTADGAEIVAPLAGAPGAGAPNASCATTEIRPTDQTENLRSVGTVLTFGKLRILDLGDLTWDKERPLVCPTNKLGTFDLLVVSHHGWYQSSSPALLDAVAPLVAIMDNGATKGGSPPAWDTIEKSPRLKDLWQLHYSEEGAAQHNVAEQFIANLHGPDTGFYIKVSAWPDGSMDVYNARTKDTKHYAAGK
ncbi:MAG: MBL fold metallo-hydrolase [Candidatus Acidiferrales bacterium]|jgi:beta-lactamase superfamily II metal-dependent hydrolase